LFLFVLLCKATLLQSIDGASCIHLFHFCFDFHFHFRNSNETSYGVTEFTRLARETGLPRIASIQNSYSLLARINFETDLAEVRIKLISLFYIEV
jgi:hypothetical protein